MMHVRSTSRSAAAALKVIAAKYPNNNPSAVISVNQRTKEKKRKLITFVALKIHLHLILC